MAIVTAPSGQTSFVGSNAAFSVSAIGVGLAYQWIFNGQIVGTNSTLLLNNLATNQAGTYCVVVSGTCGSPVTNCTTLTIQNRAPVANDDAYTTAEDTVLTIDAPGVLANDSDPDGDTLRALIVATPAHGLLQLNANGSFAYTPSLNYTGVDTFTYRASDTRISSGLATVTITITPVNDAPVANNDSYTMTAGTTLTITAPGVLANDTDVDGDALRAGLANNPAHGLVTLNADGSFSYTPATNFSGSDAFTYRANDGRATSAVATVSISVVPVPIVVVTPPTGRTNCPGDTATLSVSATGTAPTYQWFFGTNALAGETNSTLTLINVNAASAGNYCVVVAGAAGGPITNCAALVVNQNVIVATPPANQTVCQNSTAQFIVAATGTGLTYQWYFGNALLINQTRDSLVLPNVSLGAAGTYTVIVTGTCGAPVTNRATLTVNQNVAIVTSPSSQTSFVGSNATFSVGATGTELTYQWTFKGEVVGTNSTLTLNNLTTNRAGIYCVVVSGACGSPATNCTTLTLQNRAPVANNDAYSIAEDTTLTIAVPGVLGNDSDPDADSLTAMVVAPPAHGTLTLNPNGSFAYTPSLNYTGTDTFTYRASDTRLFSEPATVTITITPVNDAPRAVDDTYLTVEDTRLLVLAPGVLGNDIDVDGDPLQAVLVTGPAHGTLLLITNGFFSYTPSLNYTGVDTFTYRATDGRATSDVATVTITITPENDPPVANNDAYSIAEDTALTIPAPGVLANDIDVDGDALRALLVSNPAHGTLSLNTNGAFIYTPSLNYTGSDTFTYRATDGVLTSGVATVSITITPVNDAPVANNDSYTVAEDNALTIAAPGVLANDTDVDGDVLRALLASNPAHGAVTLNTNGSFVYTPNSNYNGTDTFTYRATDGALTSGVATVTITITPVNDAPVANNDAYTMTADTVLNVAAPGVLANDTDVENDPLTALPATNPAHGALALNPNGSFTYTPVTNYSGSDSFTYRASDGSATSGVATVTITIRPVSMVIITPPVSRTNCPGDNASFSVTATGTALTYQWLFGANILAGQTNNTLRLTNVSSVNAGDYCVVVSGAAGGPETNCATLTVNQNVIVATPPANQTVCENNTAQFTIGATGTALTYQWYFETALLSGQTASTLTLSNVSLSAAGTYTVIVSGACGLPVTNSATLAIRQNVTIVTPPASQTSFVGSNVTFRVEATGTELRYRWVFNGAVVGTNNTLPLNNLTTNRAGTYCVIVNGVCGSGTTNCVTLTIQNRAPSANNDAYTIAEDTTLTVSAPGVLANDSDIDGDTISAVLVSSPTHGALSLNANGSFTYTPSLNYTGSDTFRYLATDTKLQSGLATVAITVTPVNDAPVAVNDDAYTIAEDTTLTVPAPGVLANDLDVDGDALSAVLANTTTNGTLTLSADGGFVYRPNTNFNGVDHFTYRATDGALTSGVAIVTITVTPRNDAPVANDDAYTVNEDTALTISAPGVLGNDSDVDGDAITAAAASAPAHGTLSLSLNGSFIYTPAANYNGTDSFTYRASDGSLSSGVATVTITIRPVNDRPSAVNDDGFQVLEDRSLVIAAPGVLANDTDIDGDTLSAVLAGSPTHGMVTLNANGSFTYRPETNYFGNDSFTYRANDGQTSSAPATVSIVVLPVNDPPGFTGNGDVKVNQNAGAQSMVWARNISPGPANESSQTVAFIVSNDGNSLFSVPPGIAANGTLTFTPAPNVFGVATVRVVARDNGGTANGGVDTSAETIFHIAINGPPTVEIVSPVNGLALISPATFSVIANANDADGIVTNVAFLVNGAFRTNVTDAPFYFIMSNTSPGPYEFRAIATDNGGLTATSAPVNIEVITNAVVAIGPIALNRQNGLFEQFVTVSNRTTETWAKGVRLLIKLPPTDTSNVVWNPTGTNQFGVPYIDKTNAVPPGGEIMFLVQYYVPNIREVPNPMLLAVPLPYQVPQIAPRILEVSPAAGMVNVKFYSQNGRFYFLQSSEDLVHWKTEPASMAGTGGTVACPQPQSTAKRFYRVLMVP